MITARTEQADFDFLVPTRKELMRPEEVSASLDRSKDFVYDLVIEGKLESHRQGSKERTFLRVTRRSVVLYHLETASYEPADFARRLADLAKTLSPAMRRQLAQQLLES